jgi:hypothetical protein
VDSLLLPEAFKLCRCNGHFYERLGGETGRGNVGEAAGRFT